MINPSELTSYSQRRLDEQHQHADKRECEIAEYALQTNGTLGRRVIKRVYHDLKSRSCSDALRS